MADDPAHRSRPLARVAVLVGLAALALVVILLARRAPTWEAQPPASASSSGLAAAPGVASTAVDALPPPRQNLQADRLHERVDGAEPILRALGCRRLLVWRFEAPPADVEVLEFESETGARQALTRDAGEDRSSDAPGDEGLATAQYVFFRRGANTVRIIGDVATPEPPLTVLARRFDGALRRGTLAP